MTTPTIDITKRRIGLVELRDDHPTRACLHIGPVDAYDEIATLYGGWSDKEWRDENKITRGDDERMANAAFMVMAWNSYDANQATIRQQAETIKALVEALESATDRLEQHSARAAAETWATADVAKKHAAAVVSQYRYAIAQAKGE